MFGPEDAFNGRVLVLGASGMLGHTVLRHLEDCPGITAWGSVRDPASTLRLPTALRSRIVSGGDVSDQRGLQRILHEIAPAVVINCIGVVKQLAAASDPSIALPVNAEFPHHLADLCKQIDSRLVQISTDCVFSGKRGAYTENDPPDATDLYGQSKALGELVHPGAITLRTSIIGPELGTRHSLLAWLLSQSGPVKGYTRALFSGLPTIELARVISRHVLPNLDLHGIYHVAAAPISKFELLRLFVEIYELAVDVIPDATLVIDRTLDGNRFMSATGFVADPWPDLVRSMRNFG